MQIVVMFYDKKPYPKRIQKYLNQEKIKHFISFIALQTFAAFHSMLFRTQKYFVLSVQNLD